MEALTSIGLPWVESYEHFSGPSRGLPSPFSVLETPSMVLCIVEEGDDELLIEGTLTDGESSHGSNLQLVCKELGVDMDLGNPETHLFLYQRGCWKWKGG